MRVFKTPLSKKDFQALKKGLLSGKTVVYPTDTSYGLAGSARSPDGIVRVYKIKQRGFSKPVHLAVASTAEAKKLVYWNSTAEKLAKKFWPGALSMALPPRSDKKVLLKLSAGSGYLGLRLPKNKIAMRLAKLAGPITATSANPSGSKSGGFDAYSASDVIKQFRRLKNKPDFLIDAGKLKRTKPSTFIKITQSGVEILRPGPVTARQIYKLLNLK